jgi:hypothetical protein
VGTVPTQEPIVLPTAADPVDWTQYALGPGQMPVWGTLDQPVDPPGPRGEEVDHY